MPLNRIIYDVLWWNAPRDEVCRIFYARNVTPPRILTNGLYFCYSIGDESGPRGWSGLDPTQDTS